MTLTWDDILSASSASCNVTIVCSDGTILSHKIIVATASDFLKRLMRDTDDKGEDITILLPDFNKDEVKNLFSLESLQCAKKDYFSKSDSLQVMIKEEQKEIDKELLVVKADPEDLEQKYLDDCENEADFADLDNVESQYSENNSFNSNMGVSRLRPILPKLHENKIAIPKIQSFDSFPQNLTKGIHSKKVKIPIFKKPTEEIISTEEKRNLYKLALDYVASEDVSVRAAARKFNLNHSTLLKMSKGYELIGRGRKNMYFTTEEEEKIAGKARELVNSGHSLTANMLRHIIENEVSDIVNENPDRRETFETFNRTVSTIFIYNFTKRHDLRKFYQEPNSKPAKALKVHKESAHDNIDTVEDESEEMIEFDAEQLRTEIKELEGELLENPKTPKAIKKNAIIEKKIASKNALIYVKTEGASFRAAAMKFNIAHSTLSKFIRTGKAFSGSGRKTTYFSAEEEEKIAEKARELVNNGQSLTASLMRHIIENGISDIVNENPDRRETFESFKMTSFAFSFSQRHDLRQFFQESNSKSAEALTENKETAHNSIDPEQETVEDEPEEMIEFDAEKLRTEIKELEGELLENPKTPKAIQRNANTIKKIAIKNAIIYVKTEGVSFRAASTKYNIAYSTLSKWIRAGKDLSGRGRQGYLREEEERHIKSRAMEIVDRGENLTHKILQEIIMEEAEVLKINFPERESELDRMHIKSFTFSFAMRHDLRQFYAKDEKERNFECDVCYKRFTYKNAMVLHKKTVHYSFLQ